MVALSLTVYATIAFAQSVPMLFTGTATLNGTPAASGSTVEAYSAANALVGSAKTGDSGQAANAFTMAINNPALEDADVTFYLILAGGVKSPAAGVKAKYDAVGGPGRANVVIAAVSAQPTVTTTPGPVGDYMFSSTMLVGMIGGGLLLLATGGMMLRRKHSA